MPPHKNQPLIRIIGDTILHLPGILFPQMPTMAEEKELSRQIEHAKSVLIQTGGAGIAANQCAALEQPYQFTIVGVFYDSPEHVHGVEQRYPNAKFPPARIMVNPVITAVSHEKQSFNHGCLSVPCANRCAVLSPKTISVTYLDPLDRLKQKEATLTDTDAVVLWHELTHILLGKTYMDVTFESLSLEDLEQFTNAVSNELQNRQGNHEKIPELMMPPFLLSVTLNNHDRPKLDINVLNKVLLNSSDETLIGLYNQALHALKKNRFSNEESNSIGYSSF